MTEKRILVADTDVGTCSGFRLSFGEGWLVTSADSGPAALAEMDRQPYDVLVTSLDLPELDGGALLNHVRVKYPKTSRFVLAVEADKQRVMKHVLGSHQFLPKESDIPVLKNIIERSLALDDWIANAAIRDLIGRVRTLPPMPSLYLEVRAALQSGSATTEEVGDIIAKDMALMTKLLQLLNSGCFGLPRRITDPAEAVGILGFETIKSMVVTIKLMGHYDKVKPAYFSIDQVWRHSREVARVAKHLTLFQTGDRALAEAAFIAGLTHDLGKVVLAANFDEQYRGARALAIERQIPLHEVEQEQFGATHGAVGAYLLGRWGMPIEVLEAAALHNQPSCIRDKGFTPLTAVHVANALSYEIHPDKEGLLPPQIDRAYLAEAELLSCLDDWRASIFKEYENAHETQSDLQERPSARVSAPAAASAPRPAARPAAPKPAVTEIEEASSFHRNPWVWAGVALLVVLLVCAGAGLFNH